MLRRRLPRPTPEEAAAATSRLRRVHAPVGRSDYEVVAAAADYGVPAMAGMPDPEESAFFWGDDDDATAALGFEAAPPAPASLDAAPIASMPLDAADSEPGSDVALTPDGRAAALAGLLPATLAGGRVTPGRAGVAALALVAVCGALVAAVVVLRGRPTEIPLGAPVVQVSGRASPTAAAAVVVVDVAGKVRRPGVLTLPSGSRVVDALHRAGGALPGVPTSGLNLARRLVDGEQLVVGLDSVAPAAGPAGAAPGSSRPGGLINLNTATVSDLEELDGVGPVLAQRIVEWRDANGGFTAVDQLREITGIGDRKYEAMVDQVTV